MKKRKIHLICNAHIDPIWQWDWQEGASATIATFQSAVNLLESFDYVFCHNEVTVYKYIEEYAPHLFKKIQELVKQGKWHIIGGWYLQPDCTMPSGESFVRQIRMGQRYFQEKFGVIPTTAINFDPFGHTVGLVQIVSKCGQDSYMAMRPYPSQLKLESDQFWWEGLDGSRIKYNRTTAYNSPLGKSVEKIKNDTSVQPYPVVASLWGVGNHGGGPSRVDLIEIGKYIDAAAEEGIEIVHSTPEQFFAEVMPTSVVDKSLYICMPGCYVTMSRLKRLHIALENQLYFAEKICSVASMHGLLAYPHKEIDDITEDLLNAEFHDVLPGSSIQSGEENGLKLLYHGLLQAEKMTTKAFFALTTTEKPAMEGEYPIFVFNPHPYEYDTDLECEFTLADQNWDESKVSKIQVLDSDNHVLVSQQIKEESNLNLDWRKRVIFSAKLKPLSLNRFSLKTEFTTQRSTIENLYTYTDEHKHVEIDRETGLLKSFVIDGKEYIKNGFQPVVFADNEDPWAMADAQLLQLGTDPEPFLCMKKPYGVFGGLESVEVIENGPIYLGIEACFEKDNSKALIQYRIYKNRPYIDVNVTVFWQDINKILRLAIPVTQAQHYIGQTAFGTDTLFMDGRENVSHRFVAVKNEDSCLAVFNNCTYGSMFRDGVLYLSLLRGATYCAHPIEDRQLVPHDRYLKRIDQCEHNYSFRIAVAEPEELERMAMEFNQKPFVQNAFPVSAEYNDCVLANMFTVENKDIVLVALKKQWNAETYLARFLNNSDKPVSTSIHAGTKVYSLYFGKYEAKTIQFDATFSTCREIEELLI